MSQERICGRMGCRNDADGYTYVGDVKVYTCEECADEKDKMVISE